MRVKDIIERIEKYCPPELAYDWDNSGLLLGCLESEAKKIAVTLDVVPDTARQAIEWGADMIVAHHPLIFSPIKKITFNNPQGKILNELACNKIAVYAAHTNLDTAKKGINAYLAEIFNLSDIRIVDIHTNDLSSGLGRVGTLESDIQLREFAQIVKEKLKTPYVRVCGDLNKIVRSAAVLSGSCSEYVEKAADMGADVIITGDLKYHECLDFDALGICVIDAGHFPTECICVDILKKMIGSDMEIKVLEQSDIFKFV